MKTLIMLFKVLPAIWAMPGAAFAVLRILAWPPSRARFDKIVNRGTYGIPNA